MAQIQQVLLPVDAVPGTPERLEEYFDTAYRDLDADEDREPSSETFDGHPCAHLLDDLGDVDGDPEPAAVGEREVYSEPSDGAEEDEGGPPYAVVSIASFDEEVSVAESWDEAQEACDGEVMDSEDDGTRVALESAEIGEFRGIREEWTSEISETPSAGYVLSAARGHDVVRIAIGGMSEQEIEDVLAQQLDLLEEGPESPESVDAGDRALPEQSMTAGDLEDSLISDGDVPFEVRDSSVSTDRDALEDPYDDWGIALFSAIVPLFAPVNEEEDATGNPVCSLYWDDSGNGPVTTELEPEAVLYFAESHPTVSSGSDELPSLAAVLLQSADDAGDPGDPGDPGEFDDSADSARWASTMDACGGETRGDRATRTVTPIDVEGVHGFSAHLEMAGGDDVDAASDIDNADNVDDFNSTDNVDDISSHMAYLRKGNTSMHVIGFATSEEEMQELVEAQLDRLQEAAE